MTRGRGRRRRPGAVLAACLVLALVTLGCTAEPVPSVAPSPTVEPVPTAATVRYELGLTAWYAGLVIHVDRAVSVLGAGGGSVAIEMRLDNPGTDSATLEAPVFLAAGGKAVEPIRETVFPDVPGGGSASLTVEFDVDGAFGVPISALRIGRAAEHEVIVPLVTGSQALVLLAPQRFELAGGGKAGPLSVRITGGEVRADLPDWGLELPRTSLALTVTYDVTYGSTFSGGYPFTSSNIELVLPDGSTITARPDGHSAPAQVLNPGRTATGLQSRFEIPVPADGPYQLVVRDGSAHKGIPFTIAGAGG